MILSESILRSVITNAAKPDEIPDDYGVAWYRGMITAAQHDDKVNQALLLEANWTVDALRARRDASTAGRAPAAMTGWKALNDVQWMNIVNHDHAFHNSDKEEAVHLAVKMTEAKLKDINAPGAA